MTTSRKYRIRLANTSERVVRLAWNEERERRSRPFVRRCPQTATVSFDDGSTDGQSDSHSVILGCIECVEQSISGRRIQAGANVFYGQSYAVWVVAFRSDHQVPRTILDVRHGV